MSLLVAYWRFRAEEVRAIADEMKDDKTKITLAGIAEDYERTAKLFENGTLKLQTSQLGQTDQDAKAVEVVYHPAPFRRRHSSHARS
jgi:hypothetical protein